jgi:hypothetical protein
MMVWCEHKGLIREFENNTNQSIVLPMSGSLSTVVRMPRTHGTKNPPVHVVKQIVLILNFLFILRIDRTEGPEICPCHPCASFTEQLIKSLTNVAKQSPLP